ncbi:MAG: hypothetical protein IT320_19285 [Anaerolineae bacterium]|nr:hypothetical protein [Anaerolineae bacterium]
MLNTILGLFVILHGLVHLLYFALSRKLFELDPPLVGWPERSWAFSSALGDASTRLLATVLYGAATILFVIGGAGILMQASWWPLVVVIAAVFASAIVLLFWDGQLQRLPDKGFIGIVINVALLIVVFLVDRGTLVL